MIRHSNLFLLKNQMQKNNLTPSIFILFFLILFSCGFFAIAQDQNVNQNIFLDSDQDGLSDSEEKTYGTDPKNADTDGDGYSDGVEVKGGYNPLKPAPGDKIIPDPIDLTTQTENSSTENLTTELAKRAAAASKSESGAVSLDVIQGLVSDVLSEKLDETSLPEITEDEIKIKKQPYSKLSKEKAFEKKKADVEEYLIAVFYIFSSNSPLPLTSSSDASGFFKFFLNNFNSGLASSDLSSLKNFGESGEKMLEQLKEVEVPEEMVETHKKGLQFAKYSISLQKEIKPSPKDPLAELLNVSKFQVLLESFSNFFAETEAKISEYELDINKLQEKLDSLGVDTGILKINEGDQEKVLQEIENIN